MSNFRTDRYGLPREPFRRSPGSAPLAAGDVPRGSANRGRAPQKTERYPLKRLLSNQLLSALPGEDFERLLPLLEPVALTLRDGLQDAAESRYVCFPEDAVVSHLVVFEDGTTVETAMTGREGAVGLGAVFHHSAPTHWPRVTLPGTVMRMRAESFRHEFAAVESFRRAVLEHAGRHFAQVSQRAACINRHRIEMRLATWLLMLHDRAGADELQLTQEFIAQRIGARRAGISEVFGALQERDLLGHSRGVVRILDRLGLEAAACECYAVMRADSPQEVTT
jgi:CRP-like cAMP-binding protein